MKYPVPVMCSELSTLAYKDQMGILANMESLELDSFNWIENVYSDTQGFVCTSGSNAFVTIRGTEFTNFDDWKTNLDCVLMPCKFGMSHRGFRMDALSVYPQIAPLVKKYANKGMRIHFGGHSQGAGVVKQIALETLANGIRINSCWGFGEPRNVGEACAMNLNSRFKHIFHRVVNNNDIVTRVPTRSMGYSHFGTLHYFYEGGEYSTNTTAWDRFLDRLKGKALDVGEIGFDMIKDHPMNAIGGYRELMKQNIDWSPYL